MSWLSEMLGGESGRAQDKANEYLGQIPGVSHAGYDPYINRGQDAGGILSGQFDQMSQDPSGFIDSLMKNYSQSEGYKQKLGEMTGAAANTAAAGGMRGTQQDQLGQEKITQGLLNEDMQNYLSQVLGAQKTGLAGEQGLYGIGYDASKGLTGDLTNALGQQGGMAYQAEQDRQKKHQDWITGILKGIGTGAGYAMGGPAGGMAAGTVFGEPTNTPWSDPG